MSQTNWIPALIVLALGVATALAFLLANRKRAAAATGDPKLADLDQRVQILLDQLRELEVERHEMGDAYAAEKTRLEAAAAAALRERDSLVKAARTSARRPALEAGVARESVWGQAGSRPADPTPAPGVMARHPKLQGALWGAGVALFIAGTAFVITREQRDRGEGGTITGRAPPGAEAMQKPNDDPELERAVARIKENPADLDHASSVSHELLRRQRYDEAEEIIRRALAVDPFHVELRIHHAVLRATRGDVQSAVEELGRLARYPDAYEALLFRGALAMQTGNSAVALDSFERYVAEAPPDQHPPQLASAISMLRQQLGVPE
jgi:tetratricopeptide (TPR) repeat protein